MYHNPPKFLFLQTNQRCNLRCLHCDFWKLNDDDRTRYLSQQERETLLTEFKGMGGATMVTCGGEPMLDAKEFFTTMRKCRELGLTAFSVTNGTRIHTAARAEQMMLDGPTEVTVSLNSHISAEHDRTRGVVGSYDVAVKALRLLVAAREKLGVSVKINAMTIVHENNYRELDKFYSLVLHDIKADKLKLNIMQPSFGNASLVDFFYAENQVKDTTALVAVIRDCGVKYGLNLNPAWVSQVKMYFDSMSWRDPMAGWGAPNETNEHICNTYERNVMVDIWGDMRLCFSHGFATKKWQEPGDLNRFWHEFAEPIREQMKCCNRPCGISHSVRREHATIGIRRAQS